MTKEERRCHTRAHSFMDPTTFAKIFSFFSLLFLQHSDGFVFSPTLHAQRVPLFFFLFARLYRMAWYTLAWCLI